MARFEPWDVIAVPFPYLDRPIRQRRPALVVAAGLGGMQALLWVLMITAAVNPRWPEDVEIVDHQAAGLPIASIVRTAKIATIDARAATRLGTISGHSASRVASLLRQRLP
jgi:mRNA interferase MazF